MTEKGGYSHEVIKDVIMETLRTYLRKKLTGKITPEIHVTQGIVGKFEMGQKATVKRKRSGAHIMEQRVGSGW